MDQSELGQIQQQFMQQWQALAQAAAQGELPEIKDRRFADQAWKSSPMHALMAHLYLLSGDAMKQLADAAQVEPEVKDQLRFSVSQWVDAMSPANFLATNPEAQQALIESGGKTLQTGIENFLKDLQKGRITQTDESVFEVGRNLAITPGAVVFQNKYFQLLQYTPTTETVYQRPLLMVPPCINKYYIMDLQPENSLVAYLVSQGFTVFMVSWRNPLPQDTDGIQTATWDDYIEDGILTAIDVARDISSQGKVNVLGFCVGGTMLTTALAVLAARGQEKVSSLTLLATMLDFVDTGALGVFANEPHARIREHSIGTGGLMTGRELASTFSFLRPNELVWNYVVSNYLKGQTPVPFDLLYWNSDSTNLSGPFFTWYFRNAYIENNFKEAGKVKVCGEKVNFGKIDVPAYLLASKEDHIVPWQTAYHSAALLGGEIRFVLGASGHIAGVINPTSKNKRHYWVSDAEVAVTPEQWVDSAREHPGSWWPDHTDWLKASSGRRVKAKKQLGNDQYPVIEDAPGSYVKVRAV
ncbi:class I poly(R)-hydroxyalkanoic acid synthase [Orrella daihaiensis]|uniref:Class I poly(R)-hydroxyalkanoic acid synthase n=2 Tax=Orrella daihaiensis TaxID=2782176 RepID=A0ABY4AMT4_9BURK|nr:class I poly(R)-hydroxyalkanoic acid synthase [Orrella daihaiensis]UOD51646.1 class I poly(R)-hydroxyalkanoic acid synthase [Orrella daihaiensis]